MERFRIAFTANMKITCLRFLEKIITQMRIVQNNSDLWIDAGTKLLKLKTASGKYMYRINVVTLSFLPFTVCRKRNSKSL